jgi:integrase/recombinase XerD
METVILKAMLHQNTECIGIFFSKNTLLQKIIRKQPAAKWSHTNTCWYIPLTETAYHLLVKNLKEKAVIDNAALKAYLEKKKRLTTGPGVQTVVPVTPQSETTKKPAPVKPVSKTAVWQLSSQNLKALQNFNEILILKAYSPSTIKTYTNEFMQLLQLLKNKPADDLAVADLKRYMVYAMEKQGISENTAHSRLNAFHPVGLKN